MVQFCLVWLLWYLANVLPLSCHRSRFCYYCNLASAKQLKARSPINSTGSLGLTSVKIQKSNTLEYPISKYTHTPTPALSDRWIPTIAHHPTPRIPNSYYYYVTKSVKWRYLGNQAWYCRSAGFKTTGKKFWIRKKREKWPIFKKIPIFTGPGLKRAWSQEAPRASS